MFPTGTYKACGGDFDCAAFPGDTCSGLKARSCYFDNGTLGGQVVANGVASPTEPTWASLSCVAPTQNSATNVIFGYPGLARVVHKGTMTLSSD